MFDHIVQVFKTKIAKNNDTDNDTERDIVQNPLSSFLKRLFSTNEKPIQAAIKRPAPPEQATATAAIPKATTPIILPETSATAATPLSTITPVTATTVDVSMVKIEQTSQPSEAPPLPPTFTAWRPQIPVDALYFDWLMGHPGEGISMETEQKVLQALYALLASDLTDAVVVPRVPTVIPQLLGSLRNKTVSAGELSRHIVKDVVLVGEVINAVNSALYNPADRINSLEKAVMILGEDGLRLLIAKVAFRPIINLNAGNYTRRAAPHIWTQSEKCAVACHQLASSIDSAIDPFQAFLTGLMKNVGLIIAFRLIDQIADQTKFKYSTSFYHAFSSVAVTLSYRIAQRWEFPQAVIQALQQQASGSKAPVWTPLGHLLHTADLLAKMRVMVNHAQLRSNDEKMLLGLTPQAASCFENLNYVQLYDAAVATNPA
ncbi:HD-like signal output (HDOD) protein [Undibacterium sp. GrIS 1.8]|uniref:HDOD domain-containing protein n=1 Tax=Undibacterium sp. GrIS 1.8 TaxID=3143934 RepID=UPI003396C424